MRRPPAFTSLMQLLRRLPLLLLLLLLQGFNCRAHCTQLALHSTQLLLQGSWVRVGTSGSWRCRVPSSLGLQRARHRIVACLKNSFGAM